MAISEVMEDVGKFAKSELGTPVEIIDCALFPAEFFTEARKWKKIEDVVVVTGDLAKSTRLGMKRHTNTSCRVYEAAAGGAARLLGQGDFGPEFMDIQGDGLFALYHGYKAYQRAFCAAVTLRTWSATYLVPEVEKLGERMPKTGFKVGMASGVLAVKNVGVPRQGSEPVWAGKPVNWAFKCAQQAERHEIIVTDKVFKTVVEGNDYVRYSCGCRGVVADLWRQTHVTSLVGEDFPCWKLTSPWCITHGDEFCDAILAGRTRRDDVSWLSV